MSRAYAVTACVFGPAIAPVFPQQVKMGNVPDPAVMNISPVTSDHSQFRNQDLALDGSKAPESKTCTNCTDGDQKCRENGIRFVPPIFMG